MKSKLLGTGLSGLVGSRIVELLGEEFEFEDLSYETGVDITDKTKVWERVKKSSASWILHLAAKTDVDECEKDTQFGKEGAAWKINVEGTRNIVEAALQTSKRVIYISTDFVFDGTKEEYSEENTPYPVNWYGVTKYEGERLVLENPKNLIMRIAYPYCAKCRIRKDFVHTILTQLKTQKKILAVVDHYFTPTFIDDIADAVSTLIQKEAFGIYHVVGSEYLTPFMAVGRIAQVFDLPIDLIKQTTFKNYYQNRATRPYKLKTRNDKIKSLGVEMRTFTKGLAKIKEQGVE